MAEGHGNTDGLNSLDILADCLGIEREYYDACGTHHPTSARTKQALLAAMGISVGTEKQARDCLTQLHQREWKRPLQPAHVIRAGSDRSAVKLRLPAASREVFWELLFENGSRASGRVDFGELPFLFKEAGGENECRELPIHSEMPPGYHHLTIHVDHRIAGETLLIATPGTCWLPPSVERGERIWGLAAQLYLLRTQHNWGIGDFGDLRRLVEIASAEGAGILGLNPLHQLFLDRPEHASPYSPCSRLLLNVLNIEVTAVPGFATSLATRQLVASGDFQQKLAHSRTAHLVDYTAVCDLKLQALSLLFADWKSSAQSGRDSFHRFCQEYGERLARNCTFHVLRAFLTQGDPSLWDWHRWPAEFRDPASPAVAQFASEHAAQAEFYAWLQWIADAQLASAAAAAKDMEVGLYRDLAVGADSRGVETWSNQQATTTGASVGAPPDAFNPSGQNWGLPPFHPFVLQEQAYRVFIELIRANMRHAGALRIDHVMALQHLYWVPDGDAADRGAYVRYPMEDLIGILALESHRNKCLIIGEDLGTVPNGFRERMAEANILSYRVLFFEQNHAGALRRPRDYPRLSLAVAANHDLPTLLAWWNEEDISLKERLNLFVDKNEVAAQRRQRHLDREHLREALIGEGLLSHSDSISSEDLMDLVHAYIARSNSFIAMPQIDDFCGETEPVNLPMTSTQYPNWRRRLSVDLEQLAASPRFKQALGIFQSERRATELHQQ